MTLAEKPLIAKPFVQYPYAFYNKYGFVQKDVKYDKTFIKKTLPNIN